MNNKYYLLRHGQTPYQADNKEIFYPSPEKPPVALTEVGKEMVKNSVEKLEDKEIDLIFSSDMFRTTQTAQIAADILNVEVNFDKRLRDTNFGIYHGRNMNEYRSLFKEKVERFTKRPENGESWNDVRARLKEFLGELEEKYKNKKILIVSHADPVWLLAGLIRDIKDDSQLLKEKYEGSLYPDVGELIEP